MVKVWCAPTAAFSNGEQERKPGSSCRRAGLETGVPSGRAGFARTSRAKALSSGTNALSFWAGLVCPPCPCGSRKLIATRSLQIGARLIMSWMSATHTIPQPKNGRVTHHVDPDADLRLATLQCPLHGVGLHNSLLLGEQQPSIRCALLIAWHTTRGRAHKARGQTEGHRGVIGPLLGPEVKGTAAHHVFHQ
jgi:hypothetical protein